MQRLYLQIYVTVLLVLAVFVGAAAIGWKLVEEDVPQHPGIAVELAAALLPEPTAPQAEQQKALEAVRAKLPVDDNRVFVMGHSNGSGFTALLWTLRGASIAATARAPWPVHT